MASSKLWREALVALLAAGLTALHYAPIVADPNPQLGGSDDRDYFLQAANGFTLEDVFKAYDDHLVPVIRFLYFAFLSLAGRDWTAWGSFALLGHAAYCGLAGLAVLRFGGTLVPAFGVTATLVSAVPLASALRFHFAPTLVGWMLVLIFAAVFLTCRYLEKGERACWWGLSGVVLLCVLFATQALIVFPVVAAFVVFHHLGALRPAAGWLPDARERGVALALGSALAVYAVVLALGFVAWDNRLPTTSPVRPPSPTSPVVRFGHLLGYGLVEWAYPFTHGGGLDETPPFVEENLRGLMIALAAMVALFALHLRRGLSASVRTCAVGGLGSMAAAVLFAAMVVVGRPSTPLSSMRYNCMAVVFLAVAAGLAASIASRRLPAAALPWWHAVLVLLAYYSTSVNLWYAAVNRMNRLSG